MKKTFILILLVIIIFLPECTNDRIYYYNYGQMKEKTIRIDIVEMIQ